MPGGELESRGSAAALALVWCMHASTQPQGDRAGTRVRSTALFQKSWGWFGGLCGLVAMGLVVLVIGHCRAAHDAHPEMRLGYDRGRLAVDMRRAGPRGELTGAVLRGASPKWTAKTWSACPVCLRAVQGSLRDAKWHHSTARPARSPVQAIGGCPGFPVLAFSKKLLLAEWLVVVWWHWGWLF